MELLPLDFLDRNANFLRILHQLHQFDAARGNMRYENSQPNARLANPIHRYVR